MRTIGLFILFTSLIARSAPVLPDVKAGEKLSQGLCIACHGPQGLSTNPVWPNLYGQKEQYLINQLMAFKSGERVNPLMSAQAATLSAQDMENVAAYFSQLGQIPAQTPQK